MKKKKRTSRVKSLTKPICDIKNCYKIDTTRSRTSRYIPQSLLQHLLKESIINIYMTGRRIYLRARANKVNNNNKISKFKKVKKDYSPPSFYVNPRSDHTPTQLFDLRLHSFIGSLQILPIMARLQETVIEKVLNPRYSSVILTQRI